MERACRQMSVSPDRFEVVTDDTLFTVVLHSSVAVCIYDAVDEAGALIDLTASNPTQVGFAYGDDALAVLGAAAGDYAPLSNGLAAATLK